MLRACAAGRAAMAIMASSAVTAAILPMSTPSRSERDVDGCLQSSHVQAVIRGIGTAGLLLTPLVSIRANQQN